MAILKEETAESKTLKGWIIVKAIQYLGQRIDGYKTIIGSIGMILVGLGTICTGIAGFIAIMYPDLKQHLPELSYDQAWGTIAAGAAAVSNGIKGIGLAHKSEKLLEAVQK